MAQDQPRFGERQISRRDFARVTGVAGAAVLSGGLLAACGSGSDDKPSGTGGGGGSAGGALGFALHNTVVPRFDLLDEPAFEKAARAAGFTAITTDANFDVQQQFADVENLLSRDIKVLALSAVDGKAGANMVRKARDAGVPVLAYNNAIPSDEIEGFVSRDNAGVGHLEASALVKAIGGKGNVVLVSGQAGDQVAEEITQGYHDILDPLVDQGSIKIVSAEFHDEWDPEAARKQAEQALTKTSNDVAGFLVNNDGMAGGVIQALQAVDLAGQVFVNGMDATNEACRAIAQGHMTFSVFTVADEMGKLGADLCVQLANGKKLSSDRTVPGGSVPFFPIESYKVSKANLGDFVVKYSTEWSYVDPAAIFRGLPKSQIPAQVQEIL